MTQPPHENRLPAPAPTVMDVAGGIGIGALTVCVALAASVSVAATLVTGSRALIGLGLATGSADGAQTTLSRAIEGVGGRTILMMLTGMAAAAGIRLSTGSWSRIAGAIGAWVFVALASMLLAVTAVRLAVLPAEVPYVEALLNTGYGFGLIVFSVLLAMLSRHGGIAGRFLFPLIAIFFLQVIVLVFQRGLRLDLGFGLNVVFALILAGAIAALALLGRNQELLEA
ncbi:MAG: hypothetical protein ABIQ99_12475 [Thermoflexales bacterium]